MTSHRVGLAFVFLFFFLGGIAHFAFAALETSIVPPYIPYPRLVVYISGVFELLGALGLLIGSARRAAGVGLMLLTVCVTPANLFMLQHAADYPAVPVWLLAARLPVQLLLIALIGWSSGILERSSV